MSKGSKRWFRSAFDDIDSAVPPKEGRIKLDETSVTKKKKISNSINKTLPISNSGMHSNSVNTNYGISKAIDWSVDLAPKTVSDLAIHQKKIEELQQWFQTYARLKETDPVAILLVSGPPGCGKSTAVKTIAAGLGYQVAEWTTPVDVELYFRDDFDFEGAPGEQLTCRENQRQQFDKFLYKTSRYCSIFETEIERKLLLVKDLPNIFLRDPEAFRSSLEAFQDAGASPLVFIATDTSSKKLDIVYNLFPPAVMHEFKIHHITLNSVSTTLMRKAVKRITSLMSRPDMEQHYRAPAQEMVDSIILSSQGDLRNVTLNVHFASLKNAPRLSTEVVNVGEVLNSSGATISKGRSKKKELKLKSVGCNESLTLMHALGRVFNPKFEQTSGGTAAEKFHHSPEDLAECFISQPGSMISLLHSNYVVRFTDIENITGAADALSLADKIMSEYREDSMANHGLNIVIRGMMVSNRKTAGGWQQIKKKKTFNKPSHDEVLRRHGLETSSISAGQFVTEYKHYLNIIEGTTEWTINCT
ncbi:cell cycle checkpoint protein RAD17 isoform X2 [Wyeomyia smithii]|uniref:cell cycle checkpoint protein RAD17 isoform X2 n=1 Tax=Wyeomyia smithii TaxID=174621 RepID=UPI002467F89D|nr:cell cycle checkpoint protein RAD17 isoform X2 [Wyeomyia smithii]